MQSRRMLLVSGDLLAASRLAGAVGDGGGTLDVRAAVAGVAAGETYDVVLVDIQSCPDPAAAIGRLREAVGPRGILIAFGPHVWKERLEAALAAGADAAASRGEVLEGLMPLLDRLA